MISKRRDCRLLISDRNGRDLRQSGREHLSTNNLAEFTDMPYQSRDNCIGPSSSETKLQRAEVADYLRHQPDRSHTGTTHGPRTEKVAILASASSFAGCASPCATRASSALDQRCAFVVVRCVRREFCACTQLCAELDA